MNFLREGVATETTTPPPRNFQLFITAQKKASSLVLKFQGGRGCQGNTL